MMPLESLSTLAALNAVASIDKLPAVPVNKRVYYCQRCLNHGQLEPRKNHKCECRYAHCVCEKCILVEKRRVLNTQLHELEENGELLDHEHIEAENAHDINMQRIKGERVPNCQKCGQHGKKSRLKGHKRVCPYKDCNCPKCQVVTERQKLMADQIKIRRRQRKDTIMNMTRENLTATLNAAAAMSAGQMNFNLNGLNALLYNHLRTVTSAPSTPPATTTTTTTTTSSESMYPYSAEQLLKTHSLFFSPPPPPDPASPIPSTALVAPIPINPVSNASGLTSSFPFPLSLLPHANDPLLSLLHSYKIFEQQVIEDQKMSPPEVKVEEPVSQESSGIIDVCSV